MKRLPALLLASLVGIVLIAGAQARVAGPERTATAKKTTVTLTGWASSPAETAALKTTIAGLISVAARD